MTPTAMSLLADRFPAARLGFASGFYYMGVPIGVGVSLLIAGYLGPAIGWRNCFYLLGGIGVALAAVMWFIKETPRRHHDAGQLPGDPGAGRRAQGRVEAGAEGAVQAMPSGGPATKQSFGHIIKTLWFALRNCPALLLTIAGGVTSHFILGAATFDQLWYVQELVPSNIRATVVAFYILLLNFIGLGVGITAGGIVIDALIASSAAEPYTKTLLIFTLISLAAAPLYYVAGRRYQGDRRRLFVLADAGGKAGRQAAS